MNATEMKGKWNQLKGQVKMEWAKLTDDDLLEVAGRQDKLVGKLQERYGYDEERAKAAVERFCDNYDCCE